MTNETQTMEEADRIREGLNQVSRDYLKKHYDMSPSTNEFINEYETKTGILHKLFMPAKYKHALGEIERLQRLSSLRSFSDNLVKKIESETSNPFSSSKINELRTDVENLEQAFKTSPQFKGERHPETVLYELQFQFPDFVNHESKSILETSAGEIKSFNTFNPFNEYFACLVKYAKNNRQIVLGVMEKMAEVYKLNKDNKKIAHVSISSGCFSTRDDAKYGISKLGKAIGFSNEEINRYLEDKAK